ncbi:sensor histidine kinase [Pseudoxanthomonas dokdonensis]|nr:sensor histidine kinase [Pseudoxanthomonas dokdonensis]
MADDGVPLGIYALAQTPDGFLWIGSDAGLHRFDGIRFEPLAVTGAGDEPVSALMASRNGDLWIGYQSGRVAVLRNGRLLERTPPYSDRWIHRFHQDRSGAVWTMTGNIKHPLMRYQDGRWQDIGTPWGFDSNYASSIAEDGEGGLWLGKEKSVAYLPPGQRHFRNVDVRALEHSADNFAVATDPHGRVWLSSAMIGTWRLPAYPANERAPDVPATIAPAVGGHSYRAALFDRDGALWGVTYAAGIYRIAQPGSLYGGQQPIEESYTTRDGLSSDRAQAVLEDREGNIWIGTSAGLDRFRSAAVQPAGGIPPHSRFGYVLMSARDGSVYVADSDSLFRAPPGGDAIRVLDGLDNPQAMCEDATGTAWLKTRSQLFRGVQGRFQAVETPAKPRSVLDCVVTSDGRMLFSRYSGGLIQYSREEWKDSLPDGSDGPQRISAMLAGPGDGLLAYIRARGVARIDPPAVQLLWPQKAIPGGEVTLLHRMGDDVIIASLGGIARLRNDTITPFRSPQSWLKGITGIAETADGYLYLLSRASIVRVPRADFLRGFDHPAPELPVEILDFEDGLQAPAAPGYARNAVAGGDGALWFMTTDGIVRIDPTRISRNPLPPPVRIVGVAYGSQRLRDPVSATLPAGVSRLEIDYTALSLSVPKRVRFRYRLEGVDQDWIEAGSRRQAFYTNLRPGDYRFHVIAANNDGVWNQEGATFDFKLPPTFVQSMWFKAMMVTAVALILWGFYLLRLRHATARLRDRFDGQVAERARIARELHDTLLQEFQALTLRFQGTVNKLPVDAGMRADLTKALDRADEALKTGRDRVQDLRNPRMGDDLPEALQGIASQVVEARPLVLHLSFEGKRQPITDTATEEMQRIAEEALRNVVKHANACNVWLLLDYREQGLTMSIRDDGTGLDAAADRSDGHFGCLGMRERAQRIGGRLTIRAAAEGGTIVELVVPGRYVYRRSRPGLWHWPGRRSEQAQSRPWR